MMNLGHVYSPFLSLCRILMDLKKHIISPQTNEMCTKYDEIYRKKTHNQTLGRKIVMNDARKMHGLPNLCLLAVWFLVVMWPLASSNDGTTVVVVDVWSVAPVPRIRRWTLKCLEWEWTATLGPGELWIFLGNLSPPSSPVTPNWWWWSK